MTRDELMKMAAEKAVCELSWDSIEYLFKPATHGELLVRLDYEGMQRKFGEWMLDNSPDAMPFRHRAPYIRQMNSLFENEKFYRELVKQKMLTSTAN